MSSVIGVDCWLCSLNSIPYTSAVRIYLAQWGVNLPRNNQVNNFVIAQEISYLTGSLRSFQAPAAAVSKPWQTASPSLFIGEGCMASISGVQAWTRSKGGPDLQKMLWISLEGLIWGQLSFFTEKLQQGSPLHSPIFLIPSFILKLKVTMANLWLKDKILLIVCVEWNL